LAIGTQGSKDVGSRPMRGLERPGGRGAPPAPPARRKGVPVELLALAAALGVHVAVAVPLGRVHPGAWTARPQTVELDVVEKEPPPLPPPPEVKPPPPEPPRPKVVVRKVSVKPVEELPPPPPNQEPPPTPPPQEEPNPPVFGVTMDSVVTGNSAVAVPVGSTLATKDRTPGKPGPPAPVDDGPDPNAFAPVPETSIGEFPRILYEQNRAQDYPPEARRMGVEGKVVLRVGLDRRGIIRSVKVIKKAGYGFDEVATQAMWKFKFSPAKTREGVPVDFLITYQYSFHLDR
jgi:protein TonB